MHEIKAAIRHFLTQQNNDPVADDDDLFARGFVTSLFAMQLVLFIEEAFDLTLENEELDLDNFRSIDRMAQLVARKRSTIDDSA